jgi:hypothetical protein
MAFYRLTHNSQGVGVPGPSIRSYLVLYQFSSAYFHFQRCINTRADLVTGFNYLYSDGVLRTGEGKRYGFAFTAGEYKHGMSSCLYKLTTVRLAKKSVIVTARVAHR